MRSMLIALMFLLLILCFCLWYGNEVVLATDRLNSAIENTVTPAHLPTLLQCWNREKAILHVAVNRRLLAEAEKSLSLLQTHCNDDDLSLFHSSRTILSLAIKTIQDSYGISFSAII